MPREIGPDTEIPFGKHKGTELGRIPAGYLKWYCDKGEIDDWVMACEKELERRQSTSERRPKREKEKAKPEPKQVGGAKAIADALIELTIYCHNALLAMGWPEDGKTAEVAQKLGTTAAIESLRQGIDVDAEMRPIVAKQHKQAKSAEDEDDVPF